MLRALLDAGVRPDLVVGTSVGAINGAVLAACPAARGRRPSGEPVALAGRRRGLRRRHRRPAPRAGAHPHRRALRGTAAPGAGRAARRPPHRGPAGAVPVLRRPDRGRRRALVRPRAGRRRRPRLRRSARPAPRGPDRRAPLPGRRHRPLHPARPGRRTGRTAGVRAPGRAHRAALTPPRNPWEVGVVAFEIARRHRFARDLATAPDGVEVHVLPAGDGAAPRWNSREALRYRDFSAVDRRIDGAYRAAAAYLEQVVRCP